MINRIINTQFEIYQNIEDDTLYLQFSCQWIDNIRNNVDDDRDAQIYFDISNLYDSMWNQKELPIYIEPCFEKFNLDKGLENKIESTINKIEPTKNKTESNEFLSTLINSDSSFFFFEL